MFGAGVVIRVQALYQTMPGSVHGDKSDVAPAIPLGCSLPSDYVAVRSST